MLSKLCAVALGLLLMVGSVSAQTPTLTPTTPPGCYGGFYVWVPIINSNFGSGYTCTTPVPGDMDVQVDNGTTSDLYRVMATAAAVVNDLPEQINQAGPANSNLTSALSGASQIFGYAKWLLSPNSAQEILGRTLAPIGINIMVVLTMIIALTQIYLVINLAVYIIKFAIWVINQILKLIPFW